MSKNIDAFKKADKLGKIGLIVKLTLKWIVLTFLIFIGLALIGDVFEALAGGNKKLDMFQSVVRAEGNFIKWIVGLGLNLPDALVYAFS